MRRQSIGIRVGMWFLIAMLPLLAPKSMASPTYTITDLGLGAAYGINESGQVAGWAGISSFQAFSYLNGVRTIFGGSFGHSTSRAWGINESGVIAGSISGSVNGDAFRWQSGSGTLIPLIDGFGINDAGTIVGDRINGNIVNAAIWSAGKITDFGGDFTRAMDINNAGQVIGIGRDAFGFDSAFVWNAGTLTTLSSADSRPQDINEAGQIVGRNKLANGRKHATLWQSGQTIDLDTLNTVDSEAYAINDAGSIVGYAGFAFIYQNGHMQLLDDLIAPNSGWVLRDALDINNAGLIVGSGDFQGGTHAFLLTPVVPLPPGMSAALFLLACIGLYRGLKWGTNYVLVGHIFK
jgi:probable HAF family extracellular repeat protein